MTLMTALQAMEMAGAGRPRHAAGRTWSNGLAMSGVASRHATRGSFMGCTGTVTEDTTDRYVANGHKATPSIGTRRPWDPLL